MHELIYQVSFNTPAFLGNAEQQAQWRTPPFKALIRQWWRVAQKARTSSDTDRMRRDEGLQFGNAWLSDEAGKTLHRKSDLLIRLSDHGLGKLDTEAWQKLQFDPVQTSREARLSADLYTGFGPLTSEKVNGGRRQVVNPRGAIDAGKAVQLRLGMKASIPDLADTLRLIHWFGTAGSRSRNGWGSLRMEPDNDAARALGLSDALELAQRYARPWRECLQLDWPHAIGSDDGQPLVWISDELEHWRAAIGRLARIRVAVRLVAKRTRDSGSTAGAIHYLGYPAGTGERNPWTLPLKDRGDIEPRLASPLRFKVIRTGSKVQTLVWHMPTRVPGAFLNRIGRTESAWLGDERNWLHAWQEIHHMLDDNKDPMVSGKSLGLRRLGASA
jgi:CRISPR-associated protein Cmr1